RRVDITWRQNGNQRHGLADVFLKGLDQYYVLRQVWIAPDRHLPAGELSQVRVEMLVEVIDPTIAVRVGRQVVVVLVADEGVLPWVGGRTHFDTPAPNGLVDL